MVGIVGLIGFRRTSRVGKGTSSLFGSAVASGLFGLVVTSSLSGLVVASSLSGLTL